MRTTRYRNVPACQQHAARPVAAETKIGRKLAALAGAAGAAAVGQEAMAITLVETANVVVSQNIPGFSYTSPTTIVSGTLRPPVSSGTTSWNVDGVVGNDFRLLNFVTTNTGYKFAIFAGSAPGAGAINLTYANKVRNLVSGNVVGAGGNFNAVGQTMTLGGAGQQPAFTAGAAGYFGFRFGTGPSTRYGWGQLTITPGSPANGSGFVIQQAYYKDDGTSISVGQVPVAVPEPTAMALLAIGSAGLAAWRLRRKDRPEAAATDPIQA